MFSPRPLRPTCSRVAQASTKVSNTGDPAILSPVSPQAHGYLTPADAATARSGAKTSSLAQQGGGSLSNTGTGDTTRLRNELEVVIVGCRGLPSRGGRPGQGNMAPAAYAHYQVTSSSNEA